MIFYFYPDHGPRGTFYAVSEHVAQDIAAQRWHGIPGMIVWRGF